MKTNETSFPGWPDNQDWPSLHEWTTEVQYVPKGTGLFSSNIGGPLHPDEPPHPGLVKKWRTENKASVSETAIRFKLSDVQVLQACR